MLKKISFWANQPRLKLTFEKIQLVRSERSRDARGDVLLQSAQKSLKFKDAKAARKDLENYIRLVQDVSREHTAILVVEAAKLSRRWYTNIDPPFREILIFIFELLRGFAGRHPFCCLQSGKYFPLYRCSKLSKA